MYLYDAVWTGLILVWQIVVVNKREAEADGNETETDRQRRQTPSVHPERRKPLI